MVLTAFNSVVRSFIMFYIDSICCWVHSRHIKFRAVVVDTRMSQCCHPAAPPPSSVAAHVAANFVPPERGRYRCGIVAAGCTRRHIFVVLEPSRRSVMFLSRRAHPHCFTVANRCSVAVITVLFRAVDALVLHRASSPRFLYRLDLSCRDTVVLFFRRPSDSRCATPTACYPRYPRVCRSSRPCSLSCHAVRSVDILDCSTACVVIQHNFVYFRRSPDSLCVSSPARLSPTCSARPSYAVRTVF